MPEIKNLDWNFQVGEEGSKRKKISFRAEGIDIF